MAWHRLDSSFIDGFEYDAAESVLRLRFAGGREVGYRGVPPDVAAGLMSAKSPGGYYHAAIKGKFGPA